MTSRSDQNQGYSPEGLKARDRMIKNGYDPKTLSPSPWGTVVYDEELAAELRFQEREKKG
jgi:hypothetical protein